MVNPSTVKFSRSNSLINKILWTQVGTVYYFQNSNCFVYLQSIIWDMLLSPNQKVLVDFTWNARHLQANDNWAKYTQLVLKAMPPIYFQGNHNRYKENSFLFSATKFSATKRYFSTQPPPLALHFRQQWRGACMLLVKTCNSRGDHCYCGHCWNQPSLSSHPLFSLHQRYKRGWISVGALFSTLRNSLPSLTPISAAFLPKCPLPPSLKQQQHIMRYW